MSCDLNIWSCQKIRIEQRELHFGKYLITIDESVMVENEDIPVNIMRSLDEIKYLTSLHIQPCAQEKKIIGQAVKYAKKLANQANGVVENTQYKTHTSLLHERKPIRMAVQNADKISIAWYIACEQSLSGQMADFVDLLEKYFPQALPRRYGSFEPPQFKYADTGKEHLISFLMAENHSVIYCTKPITHIFLSDACIENKAFKGKDYRCNKIEIELLKEAYLEQKWQAAAKRIFKEAAKLFRPFYAEIVEQRDSMICAWWWKGIPVKRGNPIILGEPYSALCGKLPHENEIEKGLYYFENDSENIKIPQSLISKKKRFVKARDAGCCADNFRYAKAFPFKNR